MRTMDSSRNGPLAGLSPHYSIVVVQPTIIIDFYPVKSLPSYTAVVVKNRRLWTVWGLRGPSITNKSLGVH